MYRPYKGDFKFVSILESHKNKKYPHIHGFTNIWMSQKKWSSMWNDCGGGHRVWIEKVKENGISEYVNKQIEVAKYVSKENLTAGYKNRNNHRTFWRSKNLKADFELDPGDRNSKYILVKDEVYRDDGSMNPFFRGRKYYGKLSGESMASVKINKN